MDTLRPHERRAIDGLLSGDSPILADLRQQARDLIVTSRMHTGVGEYIDVEPSATAHAVQPSNIVLADVNLDVEGLPLGADALLFVVDGRLSVLEFATAAAAWPSEPVVLGLTYYREVEVEPGTYSMEPTPARDHETLARALRGRSADAA